MTCTPSKHLSVVRLEEIRASNYQGKMKEYSPEEVDDLYWSKLQAKADRIELDFIEFEAQVAAVVYRQRGTVG